MAAASSNKPIGLQISLVFSVLAVIILGIVTYMTMADRAKVAADLDAAKKAEAAQKTLYQAADADRTALKEKIGLKQLERVGDNNDATSVMGQSAEKIKQAGPNAGTDFVTTVDKLLQNLGATDGNRKEVAAQLKDMDTKFLALKDDYTAIAQAHDSAKQKAETEKQELVSSQNEKLAAKDQEIGRIQKELRDREAENANLVEQAQRERKRLGDEITRLEGINDKIREELDGLKQISFEVADGLIRRVDNSSRRVWLNIGSKDRIRPRVTFSVYAQDNSGIGRGQEDIKGKIEVTKIIDGDMCEAKILEEDIYRPMAAGDQVYSPLWSPGRVENFSFVGVIDVDNDGRDDRELLHQIVAINGANIDNEVNELGERTGDGITEHTKFLVLGDIPNIADLANEDEKERLKKVMEHLKDLRREARLNGVRIVNLTDFLSYIGYKSKRRLFQPGQERPFTLRSGGHSTATNENLNPTSREASGNVSGAIMKGKGQKLQNVSPGQTSKTFGPKQGY